MGRKIIESTRAILDRIRSGVSMAVFVNPRKGGNGSPKATRLAHYMASTVIAMLALFQTAVAPTASAGTGIPPGVEVKKSVKDIGNNDNLAQAGEELLYTITVDNSLGSTKLENVRISDVIPAGTTFVPTNFTGTYTGSEVSWDPFDVPAGGSITQSFRVQVVSDLTGIPLIHNEATVVIDGDTEKPFADIQTDYNPELTVTKEVADRDREYTLNDVIVYEIIVENTGNVTLHNIAVTDPNADAGPNLGTISSLAPGDSWPFTAYHTVTKDDVDAGQVDNQATATGEDSSGNPAAVGKSTDPFCPTCPFTTVPLIDLPPGIYVKKEADRSKTYSEGETIEYTVVVWNTSDTILTKVEVRDPNMDFPDLVGTIAYLEKGLNGHHKFTVYHTITDADADAGRVDNLATMTGEDLADGKPVVRPSTDPFCPTCPFTSVPVNPGDSYGLEVTKNADRSVEYVQVGDVIKYQVYVLNNGTEDMEDITLWDEQADGSQEAIFTQLQVGKRQVWNVEHTVTQAEVDAGYVYNVARAKAKTASGKAARAWSEDGDPCTTCPVDPGCPTCTIVPITQRIELTVIKDVVDPKKVRKLGDEIEYTITVANTGNTTLSDIKITDKNADSLHVGDIAKLGGGIIKTFSAWHTVTQDDLDNDYVLNVGLAEGKDFNGNEVSAESTSSDYDEFEEPFDPTCPTCTIYEFSSIHAADDAYEVIWMRDSHVGSVLDNDKVHRRQATTANVRVLPQMPTHSGFLMDADGGISVPPSIGPGRYEYPYRICEVADPTNCSEAVAIIEIIEDDEFSVFVPNVFTPNGDGSNDRFTMVGLEKFDRLDLTVFNRWGLEVYRNYRYDNSWSGGVLNTGTYYYSITLYLNGETRTIRGTVLIAR